MTNVCSSKPHDHRGPPRPLPRAGGGRMSVVQSLTSELTQLHIAVLSRLRTSQEAISRLAGTHTSPCGLHPRGPTGSLPSPASRPPASGTIQDAWTNLTWGDIKQTGWGSDRLRAPGPSLGVHFPPPEAKGSPRGPSCLPQLPVLTSPGSCLHPWPAALPGAIPSCGTPTWCPLFVLPSRD